MNVLNDSNMLNIRNKQLNVNKIITKTKNLTNNEKIHILNILLNYNVEYSINHSGYFFYLEKISDEIINKILKCINLIEEKSDLISNLDRKRNQHLEYYKSLIENKLKETITLKKEALIDSLRLIQHSSLQFIIKKKYSKEIQSSEVDPDKLMKEHLKKHKYKKLSIHHRIHQVMIQLSRKNKNPRQSINSEENCKNNDNNGNYHNDSDNNDNNDNDIQEDNDVQDVQDNDVQDNDIQDNYDTENNICSDSEGSDKEYYSSDNNDNDDDNDNDDYNDNDNDNDNNNENDSFKNSDIDNTEIEHSVKIKKKIRKDKKKPQISIDELDYYKNLLKKGGFKFDDDKEVIMIKEEYIL